jgi:hypothetical protein
VQKQYDGRSLAGRRRRLAQTKGTDAMLELIRAAQAAGHQADYVLFDTWFSCPAQLVAVKNLGLDSIAIVKKSSRIRYEFDGKQMSLLNLIGECHSLSYDALTAHVAVIFARYMMIALEQRRNQDKRTLGELFFYFIDEMKDISFAESYQILMQSIDLLCIWIEFFHNSASLF